MTRKKTTTGTMGSKRKADTKAKDRPEAATGPGPDKDDKREKAAAPRAAKADDVIPEVAIALLEAHPTLPNKDRILEEFASFYRQAAERAAALAAQAALAAPEPEPEPEPKARRRAVPASGIHSRPRIVTSLAGAAESRTAPQPEPRTAPQPEPRTVPQPEPTSAPRASTEPEAPRAVAAQVLEVEEAAAAEILHVEENAGDSGVTGFDDLFAQAEVAASAEAESDDLFALLQKEAEGKVDEDFDFSFQTAADQSSPFFVAPVAPAGHEDSTVIGEGLEVVDVFAGTPVAQEGLAADYGTSPFGEPAAEEPEPVQLAEPSESTTMMQAMPDEEPAEGGGGGRKSRKASKKRRG